MPVSKNRAESEYRVVGDTAAIDAAALADGAVLLPNANTTIEPKLKCYWRSECGRVVVYLGDNRDVLAKMDPDQFHAVVTDPPYGLEFMGREWDAPWKNGGVVETCEDKTDASNPFCDGTQRVRYGNKQVRNGAVIKDPASERGGFQDGSGGNAYSRSKVEYGRDSHLYQEWFAACAGAVIRTAKPGAHLLCFGGTRMYHRMACAVEDVGWEIRDSIGVPHRPGDWGDCPWLMAWCYASGFPKSMDISKQLDEMHGVERTAIGTSTSGLGAGQFTQEAGVSGGYGFKQEYQVTEPATDDAKRWEGWGTALKPAWEPIIVARKPMDGTTAQNVLEHGCGAINVDACRVGDSGGTGSQGEPNCLNKVYGDGMGGHKIVDIGKGRWPANVVGDGGDEHLSRYFYSAKADESDRPHGKGSTSHPTVKPLDLMRYLVKMVCPRGGVVLDPFMGSGSTGVAALAEGMCFVGIEQSVEYADIAVGRLKLALQSAPDAVELVTKTAVSKVPDAPPPPKRLKLK